MCMACVDIGKQQETIGIIIPSAEDILYHALCSTHAQYFGCVHF